jgi:hypothetical protein
MHFVQSPQELEKKQYDEEEQDNGIETTQVKVPGVVNRW